MAWVEVVDDWRGLMGCVLPLTARSLKILISFDVTGDGIYSEVCCNWLVMEFIQKYAAIDGEKDDSDD